MPKQTPEADEPAPGTTLERLYEGTRQQLLLEAGVFSQLSDHPGEKGRSNEDHLRNVLRDFLPKRMGLGTGFIEAPENQRSRQQDIVVFEDVNNFPLYEGASWSIYPIEMVYAMIEVKTSLDNSKLTTALRSYAKIRSMSKEKSYLKLNAGNLKTVEYIRYVINLSPRFFIFAYSSAWSDFGTFCDSVKKMCNEVQGSFLHGVCILDKSWFIAKRAFKDDFLVSEEHGLTRFLDKLLKDCDSMRLSEFGFADRSRYLGELSPPKIISTKKIIITEEPFAQIEMNGSDTE